MRFHLFLIGLALTGCTKDDPALDTDPGSDVDTSVDTEVDTEPDTEPDTEGDPERCDDSLFIETFPFRFSGSDFWTDYGDTGDYTTNSGCRAGLLGLPTRRLEVMGEVGKKLVVREVGSTFDAVADVIDGCSPGDACLAGMDDPDEFLEYEFQSNDPVLLVLGAYDIFSQRQTYDFTVDIVDVESCTDTIDNDGDGFTSCRDDNCWDSPACTDFCPSEVAVLEQVIQATEADFDVRFEESGAPRRAMIRHVSAQQGQLVHAEASTSDVAIAIVDSCDVVVDEILVLGLDSVDYIAEETGDYYIVMYTLLDNRTLDFSYKVNVEDLDICGDSSTPLQISGSNWAAAGLLDLVEHDGSNSCAFSFPASPDYAVTRYVAAGETIRVTQNGGLDITVNITQGLDSCNPGADGGSCIASQDDPDGIEYKVTESDDYAIVISSYYSDLTDLPTDYDISIDILPPESCDNGLDDDDDGLTDCDDSDCETALACAAVECPAPVPPSALPIQVIGSDFNADFADQLDYDELNGCEYGGGPSAIWTVEALAGDTIVVTESGDVDAVLNITRGPDACAPSDNGNTCVFSLDDGPTGDDGLDRRFEVVEDGVYHVIVSNYSRLTSDYNLTVDVEPPALCDDLEVLTSGTVFVDGIWTDLDDRLYLPGVGGCEAGSSANNGDLSGRDLILPVMLQGGQTITISDIYDQGHDIDFIVNIFRGTCEEAVENPSCVYSDDDPNGSSAAEVYVYQAPPFTVSLLYYVVISSYYTDYSIGGSTIYDEYAFQVVVSDP